MKQMVYQKILYDRTWYTTFIQFCIRSYCSNHKTTYVHKQCIRERTK